MGGTNNQPTNIRALSGSWKQLMSFSHARGEDVLQKLKPVLHRCTLTRGRMMHVVNNLCGFLMFEVLESAWAGLLEGVQNAACLDDVIRAHDAYLREIMNRALLAPQVGTFYEATSWLSNFSIQHFLILPFILISTP